MHITAGPAPRGLKRALCLGLVLVLVSAYVGFGRSKAADTKEAQIMMLRQQIDDINDRIAGAEAELRAVGGPNWCCGCGWMALAVLPGLAIWYFTDIKPKEDRKREIQRRIDNLQMEKRSLQNQLMILQAGD